MYVIYRRNLCWNIATHFIYIYGNKRILILLGFTVCLENYSKMKKRMKKKEQDKNKKTGKIK
jgi:hypothetical protein